MLDMAPPEIELSDQSTADQMRLIKQAAHQYLGAKWQFYRTIKYAGQNTNLFHRASLVEQMKATRSALRFTTKTARNAYRLVYKSCLTDIRANRKIEQGDFPALPEIMEGKSALALKPEFDGIIISWTPIKFFLTAKKIRDKGVATERHSEGLVSKLFFKVAAYYALPENWDVSRLSVYLQRLDKDSSFQDVVTALEPLKADLFQFSEQYQPFKFGKPILAKDVPQEDTAFNDAMGNESFGSELRTLYWQHFIYWGLELFLFRYYLTLVSSTESRHAIRYLTSIFEPALAKAIENKNVFLGSFETEMTKRRYRVPLEKLRQEQAKRPLRKKVKAGKNIFITYNYTLPLLERMRINFDPDLEGSTDSQWASFLQKNILQNSPASTAAEEIPVISQEAREYILMQIMNFMIKCNEFRHLARLRILENFKKRVRLDKELASKRMVEIRKNTEKKILLLSKKVTKLQRLKQAESAEVFRQDIEKIKEKVESRCQLIQEQTQAGLKLQQRRLRGLFNEIQRENQQSKGLSSKSIFELLKRLDETGEFVGEFNRFVAADIQIEYNRELEPFYNHMFDILEPSPQEKIIFIQSIKKSGREGVVKLSLSPEEEEFQQNMIAALKGKIKQTMSDIFDHKVIFMTLTIPVEDLFKMSITNASLGNLLRLKVMSRKRAKVRTLPIETIKALMVLNLVMNPVPRYDLILSERKDERDPTKALDTSLLNKLIIQISA